MATITTVETPLARRGRENQIIGRSGRPLLVIVEGTDIDAMIDAGIEVLGGLGRVLAGTREVVLKPNTNQRDPFPSTTAPETVRAVARHLRAAGATRIALHEDHKAELDLYYDPAALPGIEIQLSHSPSPDHYVLVEFDGWRGDAAPPLAQGEARGMMRMLQGGYTRTEGPRLRVARQLQEAPLVINMPVLKRHFAGQITSALKNNFGSVYGAHRWLAHSALQTDRDYFDRKLAEFASAVRPELTITDVRALQAVFGPNRQAGVTRIVDGVNKLILTGDMVAADAVALEIMKQHDDTFTAENAAIVRRQFAHAEELGLGTSDLSRFEIIEIKV